MKISLALVDENGKIVTDPKIIEQFIESSKADCGTHTLTMNDLPTVTFDLRGVNYENP